MAASASRADAAGTETDNIHTRGSRRRQTQAKPARQQEVPPYLEGARTEQGTLPQVLREAQGRVHQGCRAVQGKLRAVLRNRVQLVGLLAQKDSCQQVPDFRSSRDVRKDTRRLARQGKEGLRVHLRRLQEEMSFVYLREAVGKPAAFFIY